MRWEMGCFVTSTCAPESHGELFPSTVLSSVFMIASSASPTSADDRRTPNPSVPDDLAERDQWVLWRYENRNGRPTKVPYEPTGRNANTTDHPTGANF